MTEQGYDKSFGLKLHQAQTMNGKVHLFNLPFLSPIFPFSLLAEGNVLSFHKFVIFLHQSLYTWKKLKGEGQNNGFSII